MPDGLSLWQRTIRQLHWYRARLQVMSGSEIIGRLVNLFQIGYERAWLQFHPPETRSVAFSTGRLTFDRAARDQHREILASHMEGIRQRAERILNEPLRVFGVEAKLGRPPDWHRDHWTGKSIPIRFWASYGTNMSATVNRKYVWELNRHQHWTLLARAHYLILDRRFAAEVLGQWESWIDNNPPLRGMNWTSPLEIGIRLISWAFAYEFLYEELPAALRSRIGESVTAQANHIARHLSRGSSANNHLIGEAAALYIVGLYFCGLPHSKRWRDLGRRELVRGMAAQVANDGTHREQATSYHCLVLEFFILAALVGRANCDDVPNEFWTGINRMLDAIAVLIDVKGCLPRFGDGDDALVLNLDDSPDWNRASSLLSTGAAMFGRSDLAALARGWDERSYWLAGATVDRILPLWTQTPAARPSAESLDDAGLYVLRDRVDRQSSRANKACDVLELIIDAGPLGLGRMAAHGHADALSFVLSVNGEPFLIDPGTYLYECDGGMRDWFKGTAAHNTLEIDHQDQSVSMGPSLWGRLPKVRVLHWTPGEPTELLAEHDGYVRLNGKPIHQRLFRMDRRRRVIEIIDRVLSGASQVPAIHLHFAPGIHVSAIDRHQWSATNGDATLLIMLDGDASVHVGSRDPIAGWWSPAYGLLEPAPELMLARTLNPTERIATRIYYFRT